MNRVFAWPVGRGEGRRTGLSVVLVFTLSVTVGGLLLGAVVGLVSVLFSGVPRPWLITPIVLLVFFATLFQIVGRMGPFPERRRQVPTSWLQAPPWITAAGFGVLRGAAPSPGCTMLPPTPSSQPWCGWAGRMSRSSAASSSA
jgi:hypothetical protein